MSHPFIEHCAGLTSDGSESDQRITEARRESARMRELAAAAQSSGPAGCSIRSAVPERALDGASLRDASSPRVALAQPSSEGDGPPSSFMMEASMNILVVDVGGSHVKVCATGAKRARRFKSGPSMTVDAMVRGVQELASDWNYQALSIGYPGVVLHGRPVAEPRNLAPGWVRFDFESAFGRPVKVMNDAALQALGSYRSGKLLFLGLGTGLGSAMVVDGNVEAMELGHLPYRNSTYEHYVGRRGLRHMGKKKWRRSVRRVVGLLTAALEPTDVVIGGGNVAKLKKLPAGCRRGANANAFVGGFRLWEDPVPAEAPGSP